MVFKKKFALLKVSQNRMFKDYNYGNQEENWWFENLKFAKILRELKIIPASQTGSQIPIPQKFMDELNEILTYKLQLLKHKKTLSKILILANVMILHSKLWGIVGRNTTCEMWMYSIYRSPFSPWITTWVGIIEIFRSWLHSCRIM